ncbi:MAG: hypothetical protein ACE5G5_08535 [Candidatus Methylomirabilales bacterium]
MPRADGSEEISVGRQLFRICVVVALVAGMTALAFAQQDPPRPSQESAVEKSDGQTKSEGSGAENAALVVTSVLVSAGQIPVRAVACAGTVVVAGLAYLLTVFDPEARQGPARAIAGVCEGPYVTSPDDLRGD